MNITFDVDRADFGTQEWVDKVERALGQLEQERDALRAAVKLTRYSPCLAAVIPVTQEWVDETQKALNSLIRERDEAFAEVARLTAPTSKPVPAFDFDRAWNRTEKARTAFGGF